MKLVDLNPGWVGHGGDDIRDEHGKPIPLRERVGIGFDCPCGCDTRCHILFENPVDGLGDLGPGTGPYWERKGDDFETLSLTPSIRRLDACKWHGYVTDGEVLTKQ